MISKQERIEKLLTTIDLLGVATIKQLMQIHDLKSYRNAARIISDTLSPFLNQTYYNKQKIFYLNKDGRELIGSNKEIKKSPIIEHTLLRNEVYLYCQCPRDWRVECRLESKQKNLNLKAIQVSGLKPANSLKVVADAVYAKNGYVYFIEVDNMQTMLENQKKVEKYAEIIPKIRDQFNNACPILCVYTTTDTRKKKFAEMLQKKGIRHEVRTFGEIN
ncbi:replication-relaxation family protein [Bacillus sp. 2205SS5-2]|uniref:replication-relaxation family protein n=1 Tax=Bacillus sp. 2205SS5-2 TaxID=3109031 RepID=UPI0030044FE3